MPSACDIAREVCGIRERGFRPFDGCVPGTPPKALKKLGKVKTAMGHACYTLECAIKNEVDYCARCDRSRYDASYDQGFPYSKQTLQKLCWEKREGGYRACRLPWPSPNGCHVGLW